MNSHPDPVEPQHDPEKGDDFPLPQEREPQPIFNLPGIIVFLIGLLAAIHVVRVNVLSDADDFALVSALAFIPASYSSLAAQLPFPLSGWWSPVSYSLLHGDVTHLAMNALWMAAFGSPIAKRFGLVRFLLLSIVCSIGGALFHYISHPGELVPMIGASGAVSGYMGAAGRFAFNNMGSRKGLQPDGPALSLGESLSNRNFLTFSLVWLVINYVLGSGILPLMDGGAGIAWQAHVGGFLAGILLFSLFDRPTNPSEA